MQITAMFWSNYCSKHQLNATNSKEIFRSFCREKKKINWRQLQHKFALTLISLISIRNFERETYKSRDSLCACNKLIHIQFLKTIIKLDLNAISSDSRSSWNFFMNFLHNKHNKMHLTMLCERCANTFFQQFFRYWTS